MGGPLLFSHPLMPYLFFGIICLLFGSNFYLMKLASSAYGPVTIGASRLIGGALMLLAIWAVSSRRALLTKRELLLAAVIGVVGHSYPYATQPALIANGSEHSFIAMMVSFTPMSIMLVSIPVLGVWPTRRQLVGVVGGLAFLALLMMDGHLRGYSLAVLAIAISVPLSYGLANTYLRKTLHQADPLPVTIVMLGVAGLVLVPAAGFTPLLETLNVLPPAQPFDYPLATAALIMLGPIGTGLTMYLWVRLVSTQGPLFAGMTTYVVPVVAMFWGRFDGERITPLQLAAIAGVLGMVALVQYRAADKAPTPPSPSRPKQPASERELVCAGASR